MDISRAGGASQKGNIKPPSSTEEAQPYQSNVGSTAKTDAVSATPTTPAGKDKPQEQQPFETQRRPLSEKDIADQLLKLQKSPTLENKQILSTMIQYGLEANMETFDIIETLIKGRKKGNALESAVIAKSKGLSEQTRSVDIMSQFFASQTEIGKNLKKLQMTTNQFYKHIHQYKSLFESGLFTGFAAIASELDTDLKKYLKKADDNALNLNVLKRGPMINDLKLFSEFLSGIDEKLAKIMPQSARVMRFREQLQFLQQTLKTSIESLVSQLILSKESANLPLDRFAYWQIPNPMSQTTGNIDLLVEKEKKDGKAVINPSVTRIVLKFETPELGEVTIVIDVKENKLSYVFRSQSGDTRQFISQMSKELKGRMESLNYEVVKIQTLEKKLDIKKLLLPTLNLDKLTRIVTEV